MQSAGLIRYKRGQISIADRLAEADARPLYDDQKPIHFAELPLNVPLVAEKDCF